jgi:hypothetical protein
VSLATKHIVRLVLRSGARLMERSISRRCLAIRVPAVLRRPEHLIDAHDAAVVVNALASIDLENLRVRHLRTERNATPELAAHTKPILAKSQSGFSQEATKRAEATRILLDRRRRWPHPASIRTHSGSAIRTTLEPLNSRVLAR